MARPETQCSRIIIKFNWIILKFWNLWKIFFVCFTSLPKIYWQWNFPVFAQKKRSTANRFVETFYNQRKSSRNWKLKTRIKWNARFLTSSKRIKRSNDLEHTHKFLHTSAPIHPHHLLWHVERGVVHICRIIKATHTNTNLYTHVHLYTPTIYCGTLKEVWCTYVK